MALQSAERNKLIKNTALFLHLYERTNPEQKKANIVRCLGDGADVNATDANNTNNTPAHVAVQIAEKEILRLLVDKGANLDQINSAGKTPHDLAHDIGETKEIEELLKTLINTTSHSDNHPEIALETNRNSVTPFFYEKRSGTSGVRGQLYETKLLTLVLLRVLHDRDIAEFHLGTNLNKIGALDDICLRYVIKGYNKPVIFFLQAKHKDNTERGKLTVEDIRKETGDFSMLKYFLSYLDIKESFQTNTKDPMFAGELNDMDCSFILYTPIKNEFSRKRKGIKQRNNKINDFIGTGQGDVFQYEYEDRDITYLTKATVLCHLKMLAHNFIECIMSEKENSEIIMGDQLIKRYHVILSREVIQVSADDLSSDAVHVNHQHTGRFRPEFFTSSSNYIVSLREYFYQEMLTTHCDKTPFSEGEVVNVLCDLLREACPATISKAIGRLVTFNEKFNKLELVRNKTIAKDLKDLRRFELDNITESLKYMTFDINKIKEAVRLKLLSTKFKLPSWFGNLDMTLRGDTSKIEDKLGKLADKFVALFKEYKDVKVIEVNESIVGPKKFLEKGNVSVNGGIGGAVGNLLVFDLITKTFRFDTDNVNLAKKAAYFLTELTNRGISKKELKDIRISFLIKDFPKYSFDADEYLKQQAKDYLDKLWFYTHQANEDTVEHITRKEINTYYSKETVASKNSFLFDNHAESIFMQSHDKIQKWWKRSGLVRYLNKTNDYFEQAAKLLVFGSTLLVTLNYLYIKKINCFKVEFSSGGMKKITSMIHKFSEGFIHNVVTDAILLTGAKLIQYFENDNTAYFLDFDYVLTLSIRDYNDLIKELEFTSIQLLLVIFADSKYQYSHKNAEDLCDKLKQIIKSFKGTLILATNKHVAKQVKLYSGRKYKSELDTFDFTDLSESSQNEILKETRILFQCHSIPLISIIDQKARNLLRGDVLNKMIKGKSIISVGNLWELYPWLYEYDITKGKGAHLVRDQTSWNVETLNDNKDDANPVFVSTTSTIRSELDINVFGYLVTNTKGANVFPWIVKFHYDTFPWYENEERDDDTMDVVKAVKIIIPMHCVNDIYVEYLNLDEIDGQIILRDDNKFLNRHSVDTIFEVQLFIHFFNRNKMTFLFFINESIPVITRNRFNYTKNTMQLIKTLRDNGKIVWIHYKQTDSNRNERLELQQYVSEFGKPYILKGIHDFTEDKM